MAKAEKNTTNFLSTLQVAFLLKSNLKQLEFLAPCFSF